MLLFQGIGDPYNNTDLQNMNGCNFFLIVGTLMGWYFGSILAFQLERDVFLREQANQLYSPYCYFLAKNLIEFPFACLTPLLEMLVMYWGVGYTHFFEMYLVLIVVAQTSVGAGLFISALAPNVTAATSIAPALTMPWILYGGLFANSGLLPAWESWLQYLSPVRYANESLAQS